MKAIKIFILGIIVFTMVSISTNTYAQEWGEIGTTWVYKELPVFGGVNYLEYKIAKDTVVNFLNCKKIDVYRHEYLISPDGTEFAYIDSPEILQEVYLRESNDSIFYNYVDEWRFIYSFNMEVGDEVVFNGLDSVSCEFPDLIPLNPTVTYTVTELSQSMDLNGTSISIARIDFEEPNDWQFGDILNSIGTGGGLLPMVTGDHECMFYSNHYQTEGLICYHSPQQHFQFIDWHSSDSDICERVVTSTIEYPDESMTTKSIFVFPNPVEERLLFNISDNKGTEPTYYQLFALDGVLLGEGVLENSSREIYVRHLSNGMYFLSVRFGNKYSTTKFIKL